MMFATSNRSKLIEKVASLLPGKWLVSGESCEGLALDGDTPKAMDGVNVRGRVMNPDDSRG
jgi:hypothetical protein